jgi:predicted homoserine dehydrogenase-like protein
MYLYSSLLQRETDSNPVRVGLIGAGKFGSMFLAQVPTTPGLVVTTIADLDPAQAMLRCREVGWDDARVASTGFVDDAEVMIRGDKVDVVVEATGHPAAGIKHALLCAAHGKHVVMVIWSMSRPMCWRALTSRSRRDRPAWCTRWPMAISRR